MKYFNRIVRGAITPKWMGSYEEKLHPVIESAIENPPSIIIDVCNAEVAEFRQQPRNLVRYRAILHGSAFLWELDLGKRSEWTPGPVVDFVMSAGEDLLTVLYPKGRAVLSRSGPFLLFFTLLRGFETWNIGYLYVPIGLETR